MSARDLLHDLLAAGFTLSAAAGKLLVTPASMLTDDLRTALRDSKTEVLALLAAEREADAEATGGRAAITEFDVGLPRADDEVAAHQCVDCEHFGRRRTCLQPVAAGLLTAVEGYGIVWSPENFGAACNAFSGKGPTAATDRPYRLTNVAADRCHSPGWDDAEIAAFTARTERFAVRGHADASDLAERLVLRDREQDDRRVCSECMHYRPGRCSNHKAAALLSPEVGRDLAALLQRCAGFQSREVPR